MSEPDGFEFVDAVPEAGNPAPSHDLTCVVCGAPLEYSGHGRKPKYCDEHRPTRGSTARTGRASSTTVERAVNELTVLYGLIGQGVKFADNTIGERIFDSRDKLGESYRMLLETNKRFLKLFGQLESSAAWLPILIAHGELAMGIYAAKQAELFVQTVQTDSNDV